MAFGLIVLNYLLGEYLISIVVFCFVLFLKWGLTIQPWLS